MSKLDELLENPRTTHPPWHEVEEGGETLRLIDPSNREGAEMLEHGGWEGLGLYEHHGCMFLAFAFEAPRPPPLAI